MISYQLMPRKQPLVGRSDLLCEAGPACHYASEAFMAYLDRMYRDQSSQARAANELRTHRQCHGVPLASFLSKFERELVEAGGADWADNAKITFLEGTLKTQLQRSIRILYLNLFRD